MAGAANSERQEAYVVETVAGTIPATPAFQRSPFTQATFTATPRTSEARLIGTRGQRSAISRNGVEVTGSATSKLFYGTIDDFWASLFQNSWAADVLVNDYNQVTLSYEQAIPQGAGAALAYTRFRGVEVTSGTLTLTAREDAEVSLDFIGLGSDVATDTVVTGATYTDPTSTVVLGSGEDIGLITMSGFDPLDCMRQLTINFNSEGKEDQPKIGSNDSCGTTPGALVPEITGQFYVEDNFINIYNAARAGTEFALSIPVGQTANQKYLIEFPRCQFTEAPLETGESGPAYQNFTILPLFDSGIGGTCRITRNIA